MHIPVEDTLTQTEVQTEESDQQVDKFGKYAVKEKSEEDIGNDGSRTH